MTREELFQRMRPLMPDQRFTPEAVQLLDRIADDLGLPRVGNDDWLPLALSLIKQFEGLKLRAYPDPGTGGKPWTIGWGSTRDDKGQPIQPGTEWTQEQADRRLVEEISDFAKGVDVRLDGSPVTAAQKAALVSFTYNLGLTNLESSTLLKKHKAGDYDAAAGQFALWNKASGKVLNGLVRRREAEMRVYKGLPL